jgi:hypothetical protein
MQLARFRRSIGIALVFVLLTATGCGGQKRAMEVSDAVTNHWKRLSSVDGDFARAVNRAFDSGDEADRKRVKNLLEQLTSEDDKVIQQISGMSVGGVDGGEDFKKSSVAYFESRKKIFEQCYKPLVALLEKKEKDKQELKKLLSDAATREQESLGMLKASQQNFASKHNITLQYQQ